MAFLNKFGDESPLDCFPVVVELQEISQLGFEAKQHRIMSPGIASLIQCYFAVRQNVVQRAVSLTTGQRAQLAS